MKNYNVLFAALIFGIFVGFAGFVINTPGGLTGYVTFEPTAETVTVGSVFSTSTNYTLNSTNITGLKVSGTLSDGTALVELVTANGKFLVWSGETTGETYTIVTDKESYALGGEISVTVTPADSTYTLWLTDDVGDKTVVQETFNIVIPGEYALDALINDSNNITKVSTSFTVRNDTNTSNDVPRIAEQPTAVFVDECVNSCEIEQTTGTLTLAITLSDGAVLDIESVTVLTPRANNAPTQVLTMPDITLNVGEPVIIDLNTYFTDADNDSLTYDFMSAPGVNMEVVGDLLTITGISAGETQSIIYASDLYALIESDLFTITVTGSGANMTNITINVTNTTNVTLPPMNLTNYTINYTLTNYTMLNCTNPNPNLRPVECFAGIEDLAYAELTAPIRDGDQQIVGRFTRYGNLIIKGLLREHSASTASQMDFAIGYTQREEFSESRIQTSWIDSDTGDLHLRGKIYEERGQLVPPQYNTYIIQNRNGLVLGYFDELSGDLYLKGNIVQLGKI